MTKAKRKAGRRMRQRVRVRAMTPGLHKEVANTIRCFADPCNAPLEHGIYPGQRGIITRFSEIYQVSTGAAQTALVLAYNPNSTISSVGAYTDGTSTVSQVFSNTYSPGTGFLSTVTSQTRCLGACFQIWSSQAPLNVQGNLAHGIISHRAFVAGGYTVNRLASTLQKINKLAADIYEIKWRPGVGDDSFSPFNNNPPLGEDSDTNTLVAVFTGLPASTSVFVKITSITEWLPTASLGLNVPITNQSSTSIRPNQVLAHMDKKDPDWWHKAEHAFKYVWDHGGKNVFDGLLAKGEQAALEAMAA